MSTSFRWGIISTGRIARTFAQDVRHLDGHSISAVGSRSMASADAFATEEVEPRRLSEAGVMLSVFKVLVDAEMGECVVAAGADAGEFVAEPEAIDCR